MSNSMSLALRGTLLSTSFLETRLTSEFAGRLAEDSRDAARRQVRRWWTRCRASLGPATTVRTICDRAAAPLGGLLGFRVGPAEVNTERLASAVWQARGSPVAITVTSWGDPLGPLWQDVVRHGIRLEARWSLCFNGCQLRLVDAKGTYARRYAEFDLESITADEQSFNVFWALLRADAFVSSPGTTTLLASVVERSERHALGVCVSLERGVRTALTQIVGGFACGRRTDANVASHLTDAFEQSLTVVYRILFLLFAEARGLVPLWHPIYRESYSIEGLAQAIGRQDTPRGLWEALQAISRIAHAGCDAGDLRVTSFNGRLFAPTRTPLAEKAVLDDRAIAQALLALTTTAGRAGAPRERIMYGDLGVEQLGAVYENVLDYAPSVAARPESSGLRSFQNRVSSNEHVAGASRSPQIHLVRSQGRRKATGTFYTPRSLTDFLVRRTLHPLVVGASPEAILGLRVLDPSMGSGAFLVGACSYLAAAYEIALLRNGHVAANDITEVDRAAFRRVIAERCLFGVDLNPMAVQLARLSIWLATLATDRPLTFLDHHLRAGDSLVGASLDDLARQPPPGIPRRGRTRERVLPLFDRVDLETALRGLVAPRMRLATEPTDTLAAAREKEQILGILEGHGAPLSRWKSVADLWCACWFWTGDEHPGPAEFAALTDVLVRERDTLPRRLTGGRLDRAKEIASEHRFFHWTLEFPEVFFDETGQPLENPGFDAVLGNPPWDMLRSDADTARNDRTTSQLVRFARESGVYRLQSAGQRNQYQLFVERVLSLVRRSGRVGLVVPAGLLTDHGASSLRRALIERCDTDTLVSFENRNAIFPVHRSLKFLILASSTGRATTRVRCRFGERDPAVLDAVPDDPAETSPQHLPLCFTPALIRRLGGDTLVFPDLRTTADLAILERVCWMHPTLADPKGWNARFGRELNATDDRRHFVSSGRGLPVIGGRQIAPFVVDCASSHVAIPESVAARLLSRTCSFNRPRLVYRDVASPTNRVTLIAALAPSGCVTTHTLFCLKSDLQIDEQHVLCAILNSYITNYLARQRVGTHVTVALVERLPAPRPSRNTAVFQELATLARLLSDRHPDSRAINARLQAIVARLYGLSDSEFGHILGTFPLVERHERDAAMRVFLENGNLPGW